jgi:hypothetical protein
MLINQILRYLSSLMDHPGTFRTLTVNHLIHNP